MKQGIQGGGLSFSLQYSACFQQQVISEGLIHNSSFQSEAHLYMNPPALVGGKHFYGL